MLEPEDVEAFDDRIARAARAAAAGAIRMQATVLRSSAERCTSQARTLDDHADAIEDGRADPPGMPVRLAVVEDGDRVEPDPESEQAVQAIDVEVFGSAEILRPLGAEKFDPRMHAWLDLFDDRLRGSKHFPAAVNEAADAGRIVSGDTARLVGQRVREMEDAEAARRADPDG